MSKPKTLAACLALTLAVTLSLTAVAGASGAAPASAQPKAAPRTAVGPAAMVNCQAGTSSGKEDAKLHVCVSSYGNVYSWESPAGWEFINQDNNAEGFGMCGDTGSGWGPMGWDFDQGGASGFGAPTIKQPTAGKFPIQHGSRRLADGGGSSTSGSELTLLLSTNCPGPGRHPGSASATDIARHDGTVPPAIGMTEGVRW